MKHHLPSLDALKVFEAAARHLSFSRAAEELCISKAAVSYQIRKLESELDCALFKRSVRQVFLTDGAQELLKVTQQLFSDLSATLQQIQPAQYSHDVLVGATTYVALRWLSPRMSKFTEANPGISVLLQHSVNSDDFRLHDVDLAIRWGSIDDFDKRSVLKRLPMPLFPVCSKAFLSRTLGRHDATHLEPADLAKTAVRRYATVVRRAQSGPMASVVRQAKPSTRQCAPYHYGRQCAYPSRN